MRLIKTLYKKIDDLLKEIKIVDPAVGSGAFPIGMLNEIIRARSTLSLFFKEERKNYNLKREIIENCLYGVDIEPSAVEITKLRFWLSLLVDELDMINIKPLPNLDHKIMCGNSLLEEFEGIKLFDERLLGEFKKEESPEIKQIANEIKQLYEKKHEIALGKSNGKTVKQIEKEINKLENRKEKIISGTKSNTVNLTLNNVEERKIKESQKKLSELKKLHNKLFNENNRILKKQYSKEIERIENELIEETLKERNSETAIEKLKQFKKNKSKPFFIWKLKFFEVFQRENPGFDVVIANPPYVRQEVFKEIKNQFKNEFLDFFNGRSDLYTYFYKKGIQILRDNGVLTYISSNKFFIRGYGKNTRNLLISEVKPLIIINFGELPVFKATVDSAIIIVKKTIPLKNEVFNSIQIKDKSEISNLDTTIKNRSFLTKISELSKKEWIIESPEKLNLLKKLRENNLTLGNFLNNQICAGIKTGLDSAFVIDEKIKNQLISEDPKSLEIIKPWLRGKDVKKWYSKSKYFIIYIPLNKINIDDYPAIKKHLNNYKKALEKRATNQKWFEMQQPQERYTDLFNKNKIIYPDCAKEMRACFDDNQTYGTMAMYFIPFNSIILAILNSSLFDWYSRMSFATFGDPWKGGRIIFKSMYMSKVPIPNSFKNYEKEIDYIINQLLLLKKQNKEDNIIKSLEKKLNIIVNSIYDLTADEIAIIENKK